MTKNEKWKRKGHNFTKSTTHFSRKTNIILIGFWIVKLHFCPFIMKKKEVNGDNTKFKINISKEWEENQK